MSVSLRSEQLENYESLLSAVQETPRGRAFLEEFSLRLRRAETQTVLLAVQKLETVVADLATPATSHGPILGEVRQSISDVRARIAELAGDSPLQASDSNLFKTLAEQSQTALGNQPDQAALGQRIALALKLVDDLDQRIQAPAAPISPAPAIPAQQMKYFKQDDDIFISAKPAERPKPSAVATPAKPVEPEVRRGASLVITRKTDTQSATELSGESAAEVAAVAIEVAPPAVAEPVAESVIAAMPMAEVVAPVEVAAASAEAPQKRIVIIRRAASEESDIPFLNEVAAENAA